MKRATDQLKRFLSGGSTPGILITALLLLGAIPPALAGGNHIPLTRSVVIPPTLEAYGLSYSEWSAAWWQWALEHPVEGHPFVDDAAFDVTSGQSGPVWFLASPFGTVQREITVPYGKLLFVGMLNAEASDLEGLGSTEAEQRTTANWLADHIVGVSCTVDGNQVPLINQFRVESPQFDFTAPDPWIFSPAPSGAGTAVADGYYIMVALFTPGEHTIQYSGSFLFTLEEDGFDLELPLDVTYVANVPPPRR